MAEKVKVVTPEMTQVLKDLNDACILVGTKLTEARAAIKTSMTAAEVSEVQNTIQNVVNALNGFAADPDNPTPPLPVEFRK